MFPERVCSRHNSRFIFESSFNGWLRNELGEVPCLRAAGSGSPTSYSVSSVNSVWCTPSFPEAS